MLLMIAYKAFTRLNEFTGRQILGAGVAVLGFIILVQEIGSKNVEEISVLRIDSISSPLFSKGGRRKDEVIKAIINTVGITTRFNFILSTPVLSGVKSLTPDRIIIITYSS